MSDMWTKPRHTVCRIRKQMWVCNFFVCLDAFIKKKIKAVLPKCIKGLSTLTPKMRVFNCVQDLVNMFWRAEGFGCMMVPFEFRSINN